MSIQVISRPFGATRLTRCLLTNPRRIVVREIFPSYHHQAYATSAEHLPRIARPSIWQSIIPKALRQSQGDSAPAKPKRPNEWNPATFFICILLLIGSNAIQMLTLRNEYSSFSRKADQKIALLKEVLEKVQRGENVDVEKVLGTGDEVQEQEWKDVIKNIEEEDHLWAAKDRRREKRRLRKEQGAAAREPEDTAAQKDNDVNRDEIISPADRAKTPPSFY